VPGKQVSKAGSGGTAIFWRGGFEINFNYCVLVLILIFKKKRDLYGNSKPRGEQGGTKSPSVVVARVEQVVQ